MSVIKLKTVDSYKFGQTNKIPFFGKVVFSDKGEFEVDSSRKEEAQQLVEMDINFFFVEEKKKVDTKTKTDIAPQVESNSLNNVLEDNIEEQTADSSKLSKEEKELMINSLEDKSFDELKGIASSFPKEEWGHYRNKLQLRPYIAKKITEM